MPKITFPFLINLATLLIDRDNMTSAVFNLEDNILGETNAPVKIAVRDNEFYLEDGYHRLAKVLTSGEKSVLLAECRPSETNPGTVSETLDYVSFDKWCRNYYEVPSSDFPLDLLAVRLVETYPAFFLNTAPGGELVEMTQHIPEIAPDRRHSVFYSGFANPVATLRRGSRELAVVVNGDVKMKFEPEGGYYKNHQCSEEAIRLDLRDANIRALSDTDFIADENWFEFEYRAGTNDWELIESSCEGLYDDAIKEAVRILGDEEFWEAEGNQTAVS